MAKVKIGEGTKLFKVGETVYYRFYVGQTHLRAKDGSPRFPDGFAEVACTIKRIYEGTDLLNRDRRYELVVSRRCLGYSKGMVLFDNGDKISRKRTIGNGRKRAKPLRPTQEERGMMARALIDIGNQTGNVEAFRAAKSLIL